MYFIIEYTQIYIFLIISTAVSCLLLAVAYLASNNPKLNLDKKAAYECGFEPFEDARTKFNIHFYLVGMLFLIFDLEIALIYP
jgi:NADH-quinone oxidoreductase subunit A